MTRSTTPINPEDLPQPIAWAFTSVDHEKSPVGRLHRLAETAEQASRYLTLLLLARYIEVRERGPSEETETRLRALQHPSFGDWTKALVALDRQLKDDGLSLGFEVDDRTSDERAVAFVNMATGVVRQRVKWSAAFHRIVQLRNRLAHGSVEAAEARTWVGPLRGAIEAVLESATALRTQPPLLVQTISYQGKDHFVVELLELVGTSRPRLFTRDVRSPGDLEPDTVYAWPEDGAPIRLSPLMHATTVAGQETLYLLAGFGSGRPTFSARHRSSTDLNPDRLMQSFKDRAGFLLDGPSGAPTVSRAAGGRDVYVRAVDQALADDVLTEDERKMLETMASALGLGGDEVAEVHEEFGLPAELEGVAVGPTSQTSSSEPHAAPTPGTAALRRRAEWREQEDDLPGAIEAWGAVLEADDTDVTARASLACLLHETSRVTEALELIQNDPGLDDHPAVLGALASVEVARARFGVAEQTARRAIELDPSLPRPWLALSDALGWLGRDADRRDELERGVERTDHHPDVLAHFAEARSAERPWEDTLDELRRLLLTAPRSVEVRRAYSTHLGDRMPEDAESELRALLRRNPDSYQDRGSLAMALTGQGRCEEAEAELVLGDALFPGSFYLSLARALLAATSGQSTEALRASHRVLEKAPHSPLCHSIHALALRFAGRESEAEDVLRRLVRLHPNDTYALTTLAQLLEALGKQEEALELVEGILGRRPDHRDAREHRASLLLDMDRLDEAEEAIESLGTGPTILRLRGNLQCGRSEYDAAEATFRELLQLKPDDDEIRGLLLTAIRLAREQPFFAVERVIREAPVQRPWLKSEMAWELLDYGEPDRARDLLNEALEDDGPDRLAGWWSERAIDMVFQLDGAERAIELAGRALEEAPDEIDLRVALGRYRQGAGDIEGSYAEFNRALDRDPANEDALSARNDAVVSIGRWDIAAADLGPVLATLQEPPPYLVVAQVENLIRSGDPVTGLDLWQSVAEPPAEVVDRVVMALLTVGEIDSGLGLLDEAIAEQPEDAELLRTRASFMFSLDQPDEGLACLVRAARAEPRNAWVHADRATYLDRMDRAREADGAFRKARRLAPENLEIKATHATFLTRRAVFDEAGALFHELLDELDDDDGVAVACDWLDAVQQASMADEADEDQILEYGLALAEELLTRFGPSPALLGEKAWLLKATGQAEEAVDLLEEVVATEPRFLRVMATALWSLERHDQALNRLEEGLEIFPADLDGRQLMIDWCRELGWEDQALLHEEFLPESESETEPE